MCKKRMRTQLACEFMGLLAVLFVSVLLLIDEQVKRNMVICDNLQLVVEDSMSHLALMFGNMMKKDGTAFETFG